MLDFLSVGTNPTILFLFSKVKASFPSEFLPIKSFFCETIEFKATSCGIVLPSNSGPATCPISILKVDKASVPYG